MTDGARTRDRITRLYDYLGALAQEVYAKPIRHVGDYDVPIAPADVPAHPSVRLGTAAGDAWLRVAKTPRPEAPAVPHALAPCFRGVTVDDPYAPPRPPANLAARLGLPEDDADGAGARAEAAFSAWVAEVWRPWAERARPSVAARRLYETLFQLRQRMRTDEATYELVWGHGILGWRFGGHRICHPLLVSRVRIVFDDDSGDLSVVPDGVPALELDCLQGLGVPNLTGITRIGEELRGAPVDVWSPDEMRPLYRRIAAPLGLDDRLDDGPDLPEVTDSPVIGDTWRLVVRKRRVMFLRFFEQLKTAVAERDTLPAPMVALAAGEDAARREVGDRTDEWAPVAERLLMPLPANDEQERIARKLATHSGVTVQGPPGTGKSHTIANLVSHLVAHGKRVLVTAQKDQALTVLRDKIPEELRDLSLAVLGSSSAHLTDLQRSVQAITSAADRVDEVRETGAVEDLRRRLDEVGAEVLVLKKRLRDGLEREQAALELDGHRRRAGEVADWLARHQDALARVPDVLPVDARCPLGAAELSELFALARRIGADDAAACRAELPPTGGLPSGSELAHRHDELRRLGEVLAGYRDVVADPARIDAFADEVLDRLAEDLGRAATTLAGLEDGWLARLRLQVAQDRQWLILWSGHTDKLRQDAHQCARLRATLAGAQIEVPSDLAYRDALDRFGQLRRRYAENKKVSPLVNRSLAQFLRTLRVDGDEPRTVEDVDKLIAYVELRRLRGALAGLWSQEFAAALSAPGVPAGLTAVETWIDERVQQITEALRWEAETWPRLREPLSHLLTAGAVPARPSPDDLHRIADVLGGLRARHRQRSLLDELARLGESLSASAARTGASPLWTGLLTALRAGDWERWDATLATAARLTALRPEVARLIELHGRLATVAPRWADRIRDTGGDEAECGDPGGLAQLWQWRRAETWLAQIIDADDLAEVQRRLDEAQEDQRGLTLELTRRSAWLAMKQGLGHTQRQALMGWLQTLRKIGKGTGAGANKWRAEAQRLMPLAMTAVPVWIMPYYRVVESFDPTVTPPFDVVIIDESSQCDTFALGLLGLGHKVVVVGDDRQISPSAIGTGRARVDELIRNHLDGFPNALLLDLESSLYDASARLFPGVVRLREHFRCLPQIIEFSSQHYYGGEIQPLREESADRLPGPVVRAVHVPDGVRQDFAIGNVNEAEANALVDKLVECCADPAYEGRTMGVISLLGSTSRQAQYIDQQLLDKLGPEEYERRRLRCGDAYSFQGDERDVIFISVVADDRRGAFTSRAYEQRINVAASRARDQMWVFHSVQPDQLHPDDQRAALIRYAQDGQRSRDLGHDLEARCESDFERRVLRMLLARGYLVTPQHNVGNLRIDLVVRGGGRRLAIECDGDKYHGPEQWEDDLRRQSVLERLGWRFWRVRGSAFHRSPETAMASLWPLLDDLGIRPADDGDER
ncbi:AAA domain-containing protein [Actinoallomurus soli]|uniref:AAA domain-containing protein n=1 Tax=Actinoallomurus soli TaxID=2952535 RepID=UPI002092D50E|nr:AAA domain-containing protein [Actinoallomurus soli]MCO5968905.1 AAA domain-containing protein [Actinoallomurus soli]